MRPVDRYNCEEVFRRFDDYLDRELVRLKRQAMPALERARMDLDAALKAFAAAGGHTKRSRSRPRGPGSWPPWHCRTSGR